MKTGFEVEVKNKKKEGKKGGKKGEKMRKKRENKGRDYSKRPAPKQKEQGDQA